MLLLPGDQLWVGTEDGRVWIYDAWTEQLQGSFRAAAGAISAMAAVGGEVRFDAPPI
jgi:hypothetical protein